jgi:hypothetical protein
MSITKKAKKTAAKHTPGAWKVVEGPHCPGYGFGIYQDYGHENEIASVYTESTSTAQALADAYLIAAAPDLLAAVEACLAHFDGQFPGMTFGVPQQCREVFAKARGE